MTRRPAAPPRPGDDVRFAGRGIGESSGGLEQPPERASDSVVAAETTKASSSLVRQMPLTPG
jgi:hypothetical protein